MQKEGVNRIELGMKRDPMVLENVKNGGHPPSLCLKHNSSSRNEETYKMIYNLMYNFILKWYINLWPIHAIFSEFLYGFSYLALAWYSTLNCLKYIVSKFNTIVHCNWLWSCVILQHVFTFKNICGHVWSITSSAHSWLTQIIKDPYATLFYLKVT